MHVKLYLYLGNVGCIASDSKNLFVSSGASEDSELMGQDRH